MSRSTNGLGVAIRLRTSSGSTASPPFNPLLQQLLRHSDMSAVSGHRKGLVLLHPPVDRVRVNPKQPGHLLGGEHLHSRSAPDDSPEAEDHLKLLVFQLTHRDLSVAV